MRVILRQPAAVVTPGRPVTIEVEVTNTLNAIDGLTARVLGPDGTTTVSDPPILALFPDTTGRIALTISFPLALLAGPRQVGIQVVSAVEPDRPTTVPLPLMVLPAPSASLSVVPPVGSGHHRARYDVICTNTGNTALELALGGSDPDRLVRARFRPALLAVGPGQSASAELAVRARRHLLGGDVDHALRIIGTAPDVDVESPARFHQTPLIPRGVRTALILGLIVAAWAGAFLFGLSRVFASDPLTKSAPPSFYAASKVKAGGTALGLIVGSPGDALPAGAVPKSGVVEGVGGTIGGTVVAASTAQGVGRITVEAVRDGASGPVLVSSAATQGDGTYSLVGLLPGSYTLHFTAVGFQDLWYPAGTSETAATPVAVDAAALTGGIDATVTGHPGSISGVVDTGLAVRVPVTVNVLPELGTTSAPIAPVKTDAAGHYTIEKLPTPGTYDLSFAAAGYQAGTDVEQLGGGEARIANSVRLTAAGGEIDGVVTDGTNPLGGVAITATANGQTVTSATPTAGLIGHFSLTGLATPATYLLTFTKAGFGTRTISVALGPGQIDNNLVVALVGGTGTVSGLVSGPLVPGGAVGALGGVTVTVNGGAAPVTTQTLTAGATGTYVVSGLVTPGTYTVTFARPGYAGQTLPVSLASSGSASGVNATLSLSVGIISGTVSCSPCPAGLGPVLGGVTVTVTNGTSADVRSTVTSDTAAPSPTPSSPSVNFVVTGLAAGGYSVTFSLSGFVSQTVFVQLQSGQVATQTVSLAPVP